MPKIPQSGPSSKQTQRVLEVTVFVMENVFSDLGPAVVGFFLFLARACRCNKSFYLSQHQWTHVHLAFHIFHPEKKKKSYVVKNFLRIKEKVVIK